MQNNKASLVALDSLWKEFLARSTSKDELREIIEEVPELSTRASDMLLDFPGVDDSDRLLVVNAVGSEASGLRAATELTANAEKLNDEVAVSILECIEDQGIIEKTIELVLANPDSGVAVLYTIVDSFELDEKVLDAARRIVANPHAESYQLAKIVTLLPGHEMLAAVVAHPSVDPRTLRDIVRSTKDMTLRDAAIRRFFTRTNFSVHNDGFDNIMDFISDIGQATVAGVAIVKQGSAGKSGLEYLSRKHVVASADDSFWLEIMKSAVKISDLLFILKQLREVPARRKAARKILTKPKVYDYLNSLISQMREDSTFWIQQLSRKNPNMVVVRELLSSTDQKVRARAIQVFMDSPETTVWDKIKIYETVPSRREELMPTITSELDGMRDGELVNVLSLAEGAFATAAWSLLANRGQEVYHLVKVVTECEQYREDAWELLKKQPGLSRHNLEQVAKEVPSLYLEARSLLLTIDNEDLISAMKHNSLKRRN